MKMDALIAIIIDEKNILVSLEKPENLARAERTARKHNAHCYLTEYGHELIGKEGKKINSHFQYRWMFEHDEIDVSEAKSTFPREQTLLWPDLYKN